MLRVAYNQQALKSIYLPPECLQQMLEYISTSKQLIHNHIIKNPNIYYCYNSELIEKSAIEAYSAISGLLSYLDTNKNFNLYIHKNNIEFLLNNCKIIFVVMLHFIVISITNRICCKEINILSSYFNALPDILSAVKPFTNTQLAEMNLKTTQELSAKYHAYMQIQTRILNNNINRLQDLRDFFQCFKEICFPIRSLARTATQQISGISQQDISDNVSQLTDACKRNILCIDHFITLYNNLSCRLVNPEIEQQLLREEAAQREVANQRFQHTLATKIKSTSNTSCSKEVQHSKNATQENLADPAQSMITEYLSVISKADASTTVDNLIMQVELLENQLNLTSTQKLQLAQGMILPVLIIGVEDFDALNDKIYNLCEESILHGSLNEKLMAYNILADLPCYFAFIIVNKAKFTKFKIADYNDHGHLKIVATPNDTLEKFKLLKLCEAVVKKMDYYVKEIKIVLASDVVYPVNKDGIELSLQQYAETTEKYEMALDHMRQQTKLALQQHAEFRKAFKHGLIPPTDNQQLSEAAAVQEIIANPEYDENKLISMQKESVKYRVSVMDLNTTVQKKVEVQRIMQTTTLPAYQLNLKRSSSDSLLSTRSLETAEPDSGRSRCNSALSRLEGFFTFS